MDEKANFILHHYKKIIENREFDEYDILGFLIFIRSYIHREKEKYKYIVEFADLIAHRERNKGIVMNSIESAIKNHYFYEFGTNKIKGYSGIEAEKWKVEWINLGKEYNIDINQQVIKEITLCIYSLAQKTEYKNKDGYSGIIEIDLLSKTRSIALLTTEGNSDSFFICFAKFDGYTINEKFNGVPIKEIVYTYRMNGKLVLKIDTSDEIVLEV